MKRVFNPRLYVVPEMGKEILTAFEQISLSAVADVAHPAFRRLTTAGCDGKFVLQATWMYAMLQRLFEEERRRLAGLPRDSEATQLRGLRITLKQGKKHVLDCWRIADDIQRFSPLRVSLAVLCGITPMLFSSSCRFQMSFASMQLWLKTLRSAPARPRKL